MPDSQEAVSKHAVPGTGPNPGLLPAVVLAALIALGSVCLGLAAFLALNNWLIGMLALLAGASFGLALLGVYRSISGRLNTEARLPPYGIPPPWSLNVPARRAGPGEPAGTDLELLPTELGGQLLACIQRMEQRDQALAELLSHLLTQGEGASAMTGQALETALENLRASRLAQTRQIELTATALDRLNVEIRRQLAIIRSGTEPG